MPLRKEILVLFEQHRESNHQIVDESKFLNYLLNNSNFPINNSFKGLRRYNSFIDDVQMKYSICFSIQDREANYSLDAFIERVRKLQNSQRSSLASLKNRMKHGIEWQVVIIVNIFFLVLIAIFFDYWFISIFISFLLTAINIILLRFYYNDKKYHDKLLNKINNT